MNIYLKKIYKHDISHQISITKEILSNFFGVFSEKETRKISGLKSGESGNVDFLLSTDPRLGGDIKKIINDEGGIKEDDILLFIRKNDKYILEIISKLDERHSTLSSIMRKERHLIVNFDDYSINSTPKNNKPHQRIFFGAPGTGKSFLLNQEAKEYFVNNYERVTFHPNYMYGNFVGSFKPFPKILKNADGTIKKDVDGNIQETITYEYIPGIFIKQLVKAFKNENENYLLIIEEINRANVAAVFGDIFQLLDRNINGESEYFIECSKELQEFLKKEFEGYKLPENIKKKLGDNFNRLYIPRNLYIWATMNSADQGVMPLDTAFRRRWEFKYLGIDDAANDNCIEFESYKFKVNEKKVICWDKFRRLINERLSSLNIPEDKLIGPYFISKSVLKKSTVESLTKIIKNKVLMYLYEDVAKTYRHLLFSEGTYSKYSTLCENFDRDVLNLFKINLEKVENIIIDKDEISDDENTEKG